MLAPVEDIIPVVLRVASLVDIYEKQVTVAFGESYPGLRERTP